MKLLIDTHTFLWFVNNVTTLSPKGKDLIENPDNEIFLSIASLWEIGIKVSTGKLKLEQPFQVFIDQQLAINNFSILNIAIPHITTVASLPFHHRDPFDRMMVAQALVEQIPIISRDAALDAYGITRLW
ncbi:MAG: type II toxin-antitoxin system VapC family toxin [Anaerolineae bacterium]|nr:type II toxin-antitoxin system VapC family toxin [Anaerolineae bacterium]